MANNDTNTNLVDISSNTQVFKLYNKKGRAKRIVCLVLSILLLLGGAGTIYYYSLLDSVNYIADDKNDNKTATAPQAEQTNIIADSELLQDSKVLNVMLFGEDNKHDDKYGRTDTMILLSVDNTHKKLKLTSFQRDTYVYIPGHGYDKINASYTLGGAKLSIQTIESNFGVKIDRYAIVNFDSFKNIINTLGGIEMEVTADEIEYINYQMYKNEQTTDRNKIKDKPGKVLLDGQEALWYARNRGLTKGEDGNEIGLDGDDWDRTSRQRKLLETLVNRFKTADIGQIVSIVNQVGPMVTTNLKKDEITALVANSLTYLNYKVIQNYVPKEGLWYYDNNTDAGSVIAIADMTAQRKAFADFIYETGVSEGQQATVDKNQNQTATAQTTTSAE
ncbi:MAG TPA: hypothetical protein DEO32_03985 [Ruminococcaceae bacterium]|nr:hypothetical protein [Oscillospiraceae bacterium]